MARYFFDTADGDNDTDRVGVELVDDDDAIIEAIRFAGSLIRHQPGILAGQEDFVVTVHRDNAPPLATVRIQLTRS